MLATLTDAPFDDTGWVFEDKYDEFRMVAKIHGGVARSGWSLPSTQTVSVLGPRRAPLLLRVIRVDFGMHGVCPLTGQSRKYRSSGWPVEASGWDVTQASKPEPRIM